MRLRKKPGSRRCAPVRPVSSSIVKSISSGPCSSERSSATASAAATPMPLSAPRVVPLARSTLPSRTSSIGSFVKSCTLSAFFSQTMSRCAWRQTLAARSFPAVAGFSTRTFPAASWRASRPSCRAVSSTYCAAAASFFEPRGMRESAAKCFQSELRFQTLDR